MTEDDEKRLTIIRKSIADGPGYVGKCEPDRAFLLRLLDTERAERARVDGERDKAERDLCRWRAAIQEMTPGGSEFMSPEAVAEWARMLKRETTEAKMERARGVAAIKEALGEELWALGHPASAIVHLREELQKATTLWKQAESALSAAREAIREYVEAERGMGNTYFNPADAWAACERQRLACNKLHELAVLTPEKS